MINNTFTAAAPRPLGRAARSILLLLVLLFPMGCHTGTLKKDKELTGLLEDLAKRNRDIEQKKLDSQAKEFRNFQVASSSDMFNWKIEGDAMPQKPVWAASTWSL